MKNSKNFLILATLIISGQSLLAENKQQIFIANDYGRDIAINLVWQNKSLPHDYKWQDLYIPKGQEEVMHKSPVSGYKLISIDATPYANVPGKHEITLLADALAAGAGVGATVAAGTIGATAGLPLIIAGGAVVGLTSLGYEISKSGNHHKAQAGKNHYFVVEKAKHNSMKSGQKQITIKQYESRKHFDKENDKVMQ